MRQSGTNSRYRQSTKNIEFQLFNLLLNSVRSPAHPSATIIPNEAKCSPVVYWPSLVCLIARVYLFRGRRVGSPKTNCHATQSILTHSAEGTPPNLNATNRVNLYWMTRILIWPRNKKLFTFRKKKKLFVALFDPCGMSVTVIDNHEVWWNGIHTDSGKKEKPHSGFNLDRMSFVNEGP